MSEKRNPNNLSLLQAALDGADCGLPEFLELYKKIEKESPNRLREWEAKFNSHKYPEDRLTWVKYYNYENSKAVTELNSITGGTLAQALLGLIIQNINQENLVQISLRICGYLLHVSKPTVTKSIKILIDHGYIAAVKTDGINTDGTIYMLNPDIAIVGSANQKVLQSKWLSIFEASQNFDPVNQYSRLSHSKEVIRTTYSTFKDSEGNIITYNSLYAENLKTLEDQRKEENKKRKEENKKAQSSPQD